jgi:hypothetical protein
MIKNSIVLTLAVVLVVAWGVVTAPAIESPSHVNQAEELIKKAEGSVKSPEAQALLDQAKKHLAEARGYYEQSVGKAKSAQDLAEEINRLSRP